MPREYCGNIMVYGNRARVILQSFAMFSHGLTLMPNCLVLSILILLWDNTPRMSSSLDYKVASQNCFSTPMTEKLI